jgi:kynureninase
MAGGAALAGVTREEAAALDAADPLRAFRERFVLEEAGDDRIYLDGNSLGRLPLAVAARIAERVEDWGTRLVRGWADWIDLPSRVGDALAAGVLGARPGEVLVCDSTTVNLYKLARAALALRPDRRAIVVDRSEFPTDRYVLEGIAAELGLELRRLASDPVDGPEPQAFAGDVALVVLSQVSYRSGALADLAAITEAVHEAGALVLWDLSHSAGAVPVGLEAHGVDLAVGCTYKYLNAGPGAPAFLYVRSELQPRLRSPIQGWFGQRDQFAMGPGYEPEEGVTRFLAGTPPILGLAAVEAGAELVAEAGIERLRAKGVALTELIVALHDEGLASLGFELGSPRDPARRGSHVALRHPHAWRICRALIERARVVPDFRTPDSVRLGVPPLYTRFVDVWDAIDRLRRLVEAGEHLAYDDTRARVT